MRKIIKLINNERMNATILSKKAANDYAFCESDSVDVCTAIDYVACTAYATDECNKDYAGCTTEAWDICDRDFTVCTSGQYDYT